MSNSLLLENFALHYPNMRVGRFNLKAFEKVPLHMHANQFALAYLLQGKCLMTTYLVENIKNDVFLLTLDTKQELIAHSYCILTPKINAHEIYALEDSTFLDIFAPGKTKGKLSEFLNIIKTEQNGLQLTVKKIVNEDVELPASLLKNIDQYTEIS